MTDIFAYFYATVLMILGVSLYGRICFLFPPALILGIPFYSMITKIGSVAFLEVTSTRLIEVGMTSYMLGATPRHIFYNMVIFIVALQLIRLTCRSNKSTLMKRVAIVGHPQCNNDLRLALFVSAALLGLQLANVLLSPPYALPGSSISRHIFWANTRFPLIVDYVGVLVVFVPAISGLAMAYGKIADLVFFRRFSFVLGIFYLLFLFLSGARFNGLLISSLFWIGSHWTALWAWGQKIEFKRTGIIFATAIFGFVLISVSEVAGRSISMTQGSTFGGMLYRVFALQGNVYFAADARTGLGESRSISLLLESMDTTIEMYMPTALANAYQDKGVNLAGSLPGNAILVFGYWVGLIPMVIYGLLLGLVGSVYVRIVTSGRYILMLPGSYTCFWAYSGYSQGSFAPFLEYKFIFFIGTILFLAVLYRPKSSRVQFASPIARQQGGFR